MEGHRFVSMPFKGTRPKKIAVGSNGREVSLTGIIDLSSRQVANQLFLPAVQRLGLIEVWLVVILLLQKTIVL